jgi:phenylalanyl-tRNA synthetase alpha chain
MIEQLEQIETNAMQALEQVQTSADLQAWQNAHLGKKSPLMLVIGNMQSLTKEERPLVGQAGNRIKNNLQSAASARAESLAVVELSAKLKAESIDVTLPGRPQSGGRLHVSNQVLRQIYAIWAEMGFQVYRSRDVETDEYNFQLLNFPVGHPAREMQDTFHTHIPDVILRTHTSPGQIRAMREFCPEPIRVILPGMCYRYEQITTRSEVQFHQIEGLAVGRNITFSDLKGTLTDFARRMFGQGVRTRFRTSYFPFTEPSAEMDVECFLCSGKGCKVCKYAGWLEILGCGMVHPVVLGNGGYDPQEFTGFAFGMGPERIAMLKYAIEDIRYFWGNDLRFLKQF